MQEISDYRELERIYNNENGRCCIFGAGKIGKQISYKLLKLVGFEIDCYYDNSPREELVNGIPVKKWTSDIYENGFIFLCVGRRNSEEICQQLESDGIKKCAKLSGDSVDMVMETVDKASDEIKRKYFDIYDDKSAIEYWFNERIGYLPNIDHPKTFNEKLQYIKLYDRNPLYTLMVDKYEVKKYIKERVGESYVIPTIGVWDDFDSVPFGELPSKCVLKCTHDSGSVTIFKEKKNEEELKKIENKFRSSLKKNYHWQSREWPYKNVKPRIMAEEYIQDDEADVLPVYKFFCFDGKPYIIQAIQNDKTEQEEIDYYDLNWNKLDIRQNFPNSKTKMKCPEKLEEMVSIASELSKGIPFVRVDLYCVNHNILFSEFTFFSDSGFERFYPDEWDNKLGDLIDISRI